jgi:phosphoribosylaminoimidazole carboxylase (NCAIR synthetase)
MAGSQDLTAQDFPSQKLVTSQFENHLEPFDLPLGNTDSKVAGIMVNLVGVEGYSNNVIYENIEKKY